MWPSATRVGGGKGVVVRRGGQAAPRRCANGRQPGCGTGCACLPTAPNHPNRRPNRSPPAAAGLGNTSSTLQSVLALDAPSPSPSPAPAPAPSPPPSPNGGSSSSSAAPIGAIVGGIVGGVAAVALAAALLLLRGRRRRRGSYARRQGLGGGSESPKVGAMEAGRGPDLLGFPKPGSAPNGYKVAVAAGAGGAGHRGCSGGGSARADGHAELRSQCLLLINGLNNAGWRLPARSICCALCGNRCLTRAPTRPCHVCSRRKRQRRAAAGRRRPHPGPSCRHHFLPGRRPGGGPGPGRRGRAPRLAGRQRQRAGGARLGRAGQAAQPGALLAPGQRGERAVDRGLPGAGHPEADWGGGC